MQTDYEWIHLKVNENNFLYDSHKSTQVAPMFCECKHTHVKYKIPTYCTHYDVRT